MDQRSTELRTLEKISEYVKALWLPPGAGGTGTGAMLAGHYAKPALYGARNIAHRKC